MKTRSSRSPISIALSAASLLLCATLTLAAQPAQPQTIEDIIATQLSYQSPSSINTATDSAAAASTAQDTIDTIYNTTALAAPIADAAAAPSSNPRAFSATPPPSLLNSPCGLALDESGNLYVADSTANAIWKITGDSKAALLAGDPAQPAGATNAKGTAARFNFPINLAIRSGTLYIADTGNDTIRAISPDGTVRTLAGTPDFTGTNYREGAGSAAIFSAPAGIALDNKGQIYTTDAGNGCIRKITPTGTTTWLAGARLPDNSYGGSITYGATFTMSNLAAELAGGVPAIAASSTLALLNLATVTNMAGGGYWILSDNTLTGGGAIFATVSLDHSTITLANSSTLTLNAALLTSNTLALNNTTLVNGRDGLGISVGCVTNGLFLLTTDTTTLTTDTTDAATLNKTGSGTLALTNAAAAMLAPEPPALAATAVTLAQILANAPTYTPDQYYFSSLGGMTLSRDGNYLYLAANGFDICAIKIADGSVATLDTEIFGDAGTYSNPLRPRFASNLRFDAHDNLYIADTGNSRILKISAADSTVTTLAGGGTPDADGNYQAGYQDGPGSTALFSHPSDIALDATGNLYVADTGNALIRKIDTNNNVTTLTLEEVPLNTIDNGIGSAVPDGSGGGGGGALSAWYLLALAALALVRPRRR